MVSVSWQWAVSVASGQWSVVSGQWSVVSGQWSVVSGQWAVVSGQWAVVSGQWAVVSGQWPVVSQLVVRSQREKARAFLLPPLIKLFTALFLTIPLGSLKSGN